MDERKAILIIKAFYIEKGLQHLISAIIEGENPNLDPLWALDEITTKLHELTRAFKREISEG